MKPELSQQIIDALAEILDANEANDPGLNTHEEWLANNRFLRALENGRAALAAVKESN